ncbi:MAG: DUF3179 domain-containing protein [Planctomycetota bacterium]|nr:MAG: DUF3179 domain-containing protein [Planctomycetota bacterium]
MSGIYRFVLAGAAATAALVLAIVGGSTWLVSDQQLDGPPVRLIQRRATPGFDMRNLTIPANEIHHGGPPKDGIPAITDPKTVSANRATFLAPQDRVVGVAIGTESRAYPISILTQHEIVNDVVGGIPIAVTYCPLCDSVVVFDRRTPLGVKEFGVSGLLYNSNVLMYDRSERESLWSQMLMQGVSGPAAGMRLQALPMELTTWQAWRAQHPDTDVMSIDTGYGRNYRQNPYVGYFRQPGLMFPVQPRTNALPLKEPVLGIWTDSAALAVPASYFGGQSGVYAGTLDGKSFEVEYDATDGVLRMRSADDGLSWANSFWFAWYAFHPNTQLARR